MNKTEIKLELEKEYTNFITFLNGLSTDEFLFTHESKWSAGQQLVHLLLSVKPIVRVFEMPTALIEKKFGKIEVPSVTFNMLTERYLEKLNEGGKAPNRFLPELVTEIEKTGLIQTLATLVEALKKQIDLFTEKELDTLGVPHPLLGTISLREMLYNAIYHVGHHQKLATEYLKNR